MEYLLRSISAGVALSAAFASGDVLPLRLLPYADDRTPRAAYTRSESLRVRVVLTNQTDVPVDYRGALSFADGPHLLLAQPFRLSLPPHRQQTLAFHVPLRDFRAAEYAVSATVKTAGSNLTASAPVWICPEPVKDGFVMAMLAEGPWAATHIEPRLTALRDIGMAGVMYYVLNHAEIEGCLRQRLTCMAIMEGSAQAAGYKPETPEDTTRFNASGEPFSSADRRHRYRGIASLAWQEAAALDLGRRVERLCRYPAFDPRLCTSDDYFMWTGLDYNPWNIRRYREQFGQDPPRPPEAWLTNIPKRVARAKGLIADDDPWVRWLRFCSRDVLGHYNRLLTGAVLAGSAGRGRIGPVSGGGEGAMGIVPLVDMPSGQWPPFNFGANGFNLICYYNYNFYWFPALAQMWWAELGRMGNRDLPIWLMPDTMDHRLSYHLNNWYLFMASGLDGLVYFIYERNTPAADEALRRVTPLARDYRHLLGALDPAARPIGLLVPFENSCFHSDYLPEAAHAFCNLAMAQAEVEPVWPEELPERGGRYRAILLHNLDWLSAANAARLRRVMARGVAVLADAATEVALDGVARLDFTLADGARAKGYGDLERIGRIKAALKPYGPPWADTDDPHVVLRHFRCGAIDYLWVVNVMTHAEDALHLPVAGADRQAQLLPQFADFEKRTHPVELSVACSATNVYDVLAGKRLEAQPAEGRLRVAVPLPMWQGCLLAFYPAVPERIETRAPVAVRRGKQADIRLRIATARRVLSLDFPLRIAVLDPRGGESLEYSHSALARGGEYRFALPFAANDAAGKWTVRIRELTTGLTQDIGVWLAPD